MLLLVLLLLFGADVSYSSPRPRPAISNGTTALKGVVRRRSPLEVAKARAEADMWGARRYWQSKGVQGAMDAPLLLEFEDGPQLGAGRGGFGKVKISTYYLPPNPWGMTREEQRALVYHEVRHALPGGTVGGVDGQGHTLAGLMSVPFEIPGDITNRALRRAGAQRILQQRGRP